MKEELELLTLVLVFICIKNKVRKWEGEWGLHYCFATELRFEEKRIPANQK